MSYQVFARKYRPLTFDQILGQDHVVTTLRNAIAKDRIAQAYLFVGPRGTGKTTTARILAKALNCENGPSAEFDPTNDLCEEIARGTSLDVLEIDGASNNGVEQVRELRESAKFAPSRARFKIYYIDEVHMLSTAAFNALLKTLEEPPPHVKFIFATTEPNKILPTILSRCQRFDLRPIPEQVIADHLLHIAREEGVNLDPAAAQSVARGAEGGMRDAQSMLDQLVAFCGDTISEQHVLDIFGFTSHETVAALTTALLEHRTVDALNTLHEQTEAGKDLSKLLADLITHLRNLLVYKVDPEHALGDKSPTLAETLVAQAELIENDRLLDLIDQFAQIDARMKWAPNKKMHFEIGIIKAVQSLQESNLSDVIKVLSGAMAESDLSGGGATAAPLESPPAATPRRSTAPSRSPAPVTPAPAARPAPETSPPREPQSTAASENVHPEPLAASPPSAPVEGSEALWGRLQQKFPMIFAQANFAGLESPHFKVGFHSTDFAKERAAMARKDIETALREISGENLRLEIETDDNVTLGPSASPPRAARLPNEAPEPSSRNPLDSPPASAAPGSAPHEGQPTPEPPPTAEMDEKAFYADQLIEKALDIFEAKLEKKP